MAHLVAALLFGSRQIANNYIGGPFPTGVLALTLLQRLCARIGSVAELSLSPTPDVCAFGRILGRNLFTATIPDEISTLRALSYVYDLLLLLVLLRLLVHASLIMQESLCKYA
jgi:hypothetical protein